MLAGDKSRASCAVGRACCQFQFLAVLCQLPYWLYCLPAARCHWSVRYCCYKRCWAVIDSPRRMGFLSSAWDWGFEIIPHNGLFLRADLFAELTTAAVVRACIYKGNKRGPSDFLSHLRVCKIKGLVWVSLTAVCLISGTVQEQDQYVVRIDLMLWTDLLFITCN